MYLRNDDRAFRDYNCPRPEANDVLAKQIQGLITPMKLMGNMMKDKDEKINQIIEAVEVFISGVIDLMTLFKGDYDHGDFCSGLVFGRDGASMLI